MNSYIVILTVIYGARSWGKTLEMVVLAKSRLDAALQAESIGDALVPDPAVMYTATKNVTEIINNKTMVAALAA